MDSTINAAALALARGDVLGALNRVALRDDPPALALHGIAMARLGDFATARTLLKKAAQRFGRREEVARARCTVAEAEIALVSRDLAWPPERLADARRLLAERGDTPNAAHARCIEIRRDLLLGHLDRAEQGLAALDPATLPPTLRCAWWLAEAGIHIRRLQARQARLAVERAAAAAEASGIPALAAEVSAVGHALDAPAALLRRDGAVRPVRLDAIEDVLASGLVVVDATRNLLRSGEVTVSLSSRPVLFALLLSLAENWPHGVSRQTLLARAFRARHADESHRARLRVEMTRLRQLIAQCADVVATPEGYRLAALESAEVAVLSFALPEQNAAVLALLADGEQWSSSALALVMQTSSRTVQRILEQLHSEAKVVAVGRGRSQRWMIATVPGFPTTLLLPAG